jgi:tRNA A37 threonylcarbamoyladenosine dehydratase
MDTLTIEPTYRVLLGDVSRFRIMLVGCGGTGSSLALALAGLAYHAGQKGIQVELTLVDHDVVELKNCGRQMCKLFGIEWVYLHYCRSIQYGGNKINEYRNRLEQISSGERPGVAQSLAQFRGVPRSGQEYH